MTHASNTIDGFTYSDVYTGTMTSDGADHHYGFVARDVFFGGVKTGVEWVESAIWSTKKHAVDGANRIKARIQKRSLSHD